MSDKIDELINEPTTFEPYENVEDAIWGAIEQLLEASDEVHDVLSDEQKAPLCRALNACFAAMYFLAGYTDGDAVGFINTARDELGKSSFWVPPGPPPKAAAIPSRRWVGDDEDGEEA